jgi:hypothetical protein
MIQTLDDPEGRYRKCCHALLSTLTPGWLPAVSARLGPSLASAAICHCASPVKVRIEAAALALLLAFWTAPLFYVRPF